VAKRATSRSAAKLKSAAIPDRYLICPGSGIAHGQVYLPVLEGPKVRFLRCPMHDCQMKAFLRGPRWRGDIGISSKEIRRRNPDALIM